MSQQTEQMYISTTSEIMGAEILQHLGLVYGATVRARGIGGDCMAGCQSTCGGEVSAYTEMAIESRNEAVNRMLNEARTLGANAVIGIKFDSDNMGSQGSSANGTIVYGTAVRIKFA